MNTKHKYRVAIISDMTPESPRNWDNVGTMVCWHDRYSLGDEQPGEDPQEYMLALAEEFSPGITERVERFADRLWEDLKEREGLTLEDRLRSHGMAVDAYQAERVHAILDRHVIMLPLHLMDHSGLSMNTGRYSCPWDSGQVGYIYASRDKAREEWGTSPKPDEMTDEEFWERRLRQEVETYSQYLEGDVYGYVLEKARGYTQTTLFEDGEVEEGEGLEWEVVDSCWGFFGYDPTENGMGGHVADVVLQAMVRVDVSYGDGEPSWEYFETEEEL